MPESSSRHGARNDTGEIATSTLAEIYAQQGLLGRALSIYRRMLARTPEDAGIADRIRSLEVRMAESGPEPEAPPATVVPPERERLPWDPPEVEALAADPAEIDTPPEVPSAAGPPPSEPEAPAPAAHAEPASRNAEPSRPGSESPRGAGRMDAEAFRTWLDGR
ncbi:MAG TPA: hypothetical protein VJ788_08530 [Gemmatimonadota bacterium]|nr:hypothetical protein [Gemmatimonadota bacterium]